MPHTQKPMPFSSLNGISDKTNEIHHGKLYAGYVNKRNEVEEKISKLSPEDLSAANQVYSLYRGLRAEETFAANGMILHEIFFSILGGDGVPKGPCFEKIKEDFGSYENFLAHFEASGMVGRGWAILCYDPSDSKLHIFTCDAQNQGGVWGCTPIIPMDVYEHSYFIDYGSDRKAYIKAFMQNLNWDEINARYLHAIR